MNLKLLLLRLSLSKNLDSSKPETAVLSEPETGLWLNIQIRLLSLCFREISLLNFHCSQTEQPPNVGEGHTDGDGGSLNALDAALQYNDVVNRKNDQLMKKLADVKMNSSKKDIEISRLKAQLAGSSESGHLTTSHDPRTVLPDMSPTEVHRGINQIVDHQAIMRETQTENRMLRTKVADFEIRVKSISSTDIESQIGAKDTEIDELKEEIEQLKAVAGRFEQMKEHSRGQSKEVLELKVKLQQSEVCIIYNLRFHVKWFVKTFL